MLESVRSGSAILWQAERINMEYNEQQPPVIWFEDIWKSNKDEIIRRTDLPSLRFSSFDNRSCTLILIFSVSLLSRYFFPFSLIDAAGITGRAVDSIRDFYTYSDRFQSSCSCSLSEFCWFSVQGDENVSLMKNRFDLGEKIPLRLWVFIRHSAATFLHSLRASRQIESSASWCCID